jgi:hypothetical protein
MPARKFASPTTFDRSVAAAVAPAKRGDLLLDPAVAVPDGRSHVLGEIRHELGNYFHKLYYFADAASEAIARDGGSGHPAELLGPTLRGLERFLGAAFGLFAPVALEVLDLTVGELAAATTRHITVADGAVRVESTVTNATRSVRADPGVLSVVAEMLAQRVAARSGGESRVVVSTDGDAPGHVLVVVRVESPGAPAMVGVEPALRWAKSRELIGLHGGTLNEFETAGAYEVRLSLPC